MGINEVVELVTRFGAWLDDRGTASARADALEVGLRVYRSESSLEDGLRAAKTAFDSYRCELDGRRIPLQSAAIEASPLG